MKYEKYLIKKDKLDLLSSLKALDEKLLNQKMNEFGVKDIYELKDYILSDFQDCLEMSIDDTFTRLYFDRLIENENSEYMSAYQQDIEGLFVFVYENKNYYSYYIPTEIKEIINKLIGEMTDDARFNLENAANTPIIKDLNGLLETLVVDDLKNIGGLLHVNRLSNVRKKELVKIIYSALTDKDKIKDLIERFIDKEFNLLCDLINNGGTIQDNNISIESYHFLYMAGLVFLFRRQNKFYVSMTDDIYNIIKEFNLNEIKETIEENNKVYYMVRSMVELYGVLPLSCLDYYYNLYYSSKDNNIDVSLNSLLFCERIDNIEIIHSENEMYFVNKILNLKNTEEILDDIISRQVSIKRKKFKLDELLKYSDYKYYEQTESKNKFKKYLKKKKIDNETIEEIVKIISDMYRLGNGFVSTSIEMLQDYGVEITEKNLQDIINYLTEIYNNSRVWCNNGWTPIEMRTNYKDVINN